ncbi:unnamed protein product [Colias eurytheme]|nr:unnamed protein product [Colias eurytheme]
MVTIKSTHGPSSVRRSSSSETHAARAAAVLRDERPSSFATCRPRASAHALLSYIQSQSAQDVCVEELHSSDVTSV